MNNINALVPIVNRIIDGNEIQTVNVRDLYKFLEVKTDFSNWIKGKIKNYDFAEGIEYFCSPKIASKPGNFCLSEMTDKKGSGGHNIKEYFVTLDMAKELSMVQNNPKGKEARQYFIQCEHIAKEAIKAAFRQEKRKFNLEWKQAREDGKASRRKTTDAIQEFCELAKSQGSKHSHFYYKSLTNAIYDTVIIPGGHSKIDQRRKELKKRNGRETLSLEELIKEELMEKLVVKKFIKEASIDKEFYKDIYPAVKEKLLRYGEMIEKRLSLGINNQQAVAVNQ